MPPHDARLRNCDPRARLQGCCDPVPLSGPSPLGKVVSKMDPIGIEQTPHGIPQIRNGGVIQMGDRPWQTISRKLEHKTISA
jgi:hypothetical protein